VSVGVVGDLVTRGVRTIRVDRRTPLGNPYVMRDEADRDDVCDAYRQLLGESLRGDVGDQRVREIGIEHGFRGHVVSWNAREAAAEVGRLRRICACHDVRLDCHCAPMRCHAEEIARVL